MSKSMLNLEDAPRDAIERIIYLSGVKERALSELDEALGQAYFEARLTSRLDVALALGLNPKKRVLAWTRRENERRGRSIRWGDGADPSSTAYSG